MATPVSWGGEIIQWPSPVASDQLQLQAYSSPKPMSKTNPVDIATLEPIGTDLHRPECVVTTPSGDVFVPDWRGGVTRIAADGTQETWLADTAGIDLRPNGIALTDDGSFLLANLGDAGGVWRLRRNGALEPFLTDIDGRPVPPANFVTVDAQGRTWISVSTRQVPRERAWRPDFADGFVVLVEGSRARIVAEGLHYTNEVRPDPTGTWLYVVETFGRRLTRFRITADGTLGDREVVVDLGYGGFPDGFAFDASGAIWLTSLISNRLLRLDAGGVETILEDVNREHVDEIERAFVSGEMRREHLGPIPQTTLQQLTSVAFGGRDGRTVYLGSLHATCLYKFAAEIVGASFITAGRR
jgi:sugar lactone lactonase YvrE